MRSLLIGEGATKGDMDKIRRAIESSPHVDHLIHLRTQHLGPEDLLVACKVQFENDLSVTELADEIVRCDGHPFSKAHAIVAACVKEATAADHLLTLGHRTAGETPALDLGVVVDRPAVGDDVEDHRTDVEIGFPVRQTEEGRQYELQDIQNARVEAIEQQVAPRMERFRPDLLLISDITWQTLNEEERGWLRQAAADASLFQRDLWQKMSVKKLQRQLNRLQRRKTKRIWKQKDSGLSVHKAYGH